MYCRNCGHQMSDHVKFCPKCGQKVSEVSVDTEKKSRKKSPCLFIIVSVILLVAFLMIALSIFLKNRNEKDTEQETSDVKAAINNEDTEEIENTAEIADEDEKEGSYVHDQYTLAYKNMTESGSWSEKLSMAAPLTASEDGQSEQSTLEMQSNTNVKGWKEDDLSELYLEGDGNISMDGSAAYAWTMTCKNGKVNYQYTVPYERSAETEMNSVLFNLGELPQDAIKNTQINGDQITFTISGEYMAEAGLNAIQMLPVVADLDYGDVAVTAAINESDWTLKTVSMNFTAAMTYMEHPVNADYDITYEFGPVGEFHEADTEEDSQESDSKNPTAHQNEVHEYDTVTTEENNAEKRDVFTGNVEDEVVSIRTLYNEITAAVSGGNYEELKTSDGVTVYKDENHVKEIAVPAGTDESSYRRFYYYNDDQLIFAYYEGTSAHRFYFHDGQLIRWRYSQNASDPQNAVNHDLEDSDEYHDWQKKVLKEAETYLQEAI